MRLPSSTQALLVVLACVAAALAVMGVASLMRKRDDGRETAAESLCKSLDSYLEALLGPDAHACDTQLLWRRLQEVRALKRKHFPELYAEMMEISRVHGEVTTALLQTHMQLHGAQMRKPDAASAQLETLRTRAREAVARLKQRCRETARA